MRHLIKLVILIGLLVNIDKSYGANRSFGEDTTRCLSMLTVGFTIGEYCDAPTLLSFAQVNSKVGYEPSRQLQELKEWEDNGGLLIGLFGTPQDQDVQYLGKLSQWCKGVSSFTFDDYKRLLTGFVQITLDQEAVAALSSNMQSTIQRNSNLTSSQKEFLGLLLPDKTPDEISENLGRGILNGSCECDAQFLKDRNDQYRQCTCWAKLSDSDLRRITPRILSIADQIESSNTLIKLLLAHIERKNSSIFWPMKYPNPELRVALISKLKEELAAKKYTGSDTFKCMGLFAFLGCWDEVDQLSILAIEQSKSISDYVLKRSFLFLYTSAMMPMLRKARVICWLSLKLGLVKS